MPTDPEPLKCSLGLLTLLTGSLIKESNKFLSHVLFDLRILICFFELTK